MDFEQVHNYYERLVFEDIVRRSAQYRNFTPTMLSDVACVALNQLPARYVRHDVDLVFYLTEQERHEVSIALSAAVEYAFAFVGKRAGDASA